MIISIKDSLKLIAVAVICFCAVFVCTFMLNFYMDVLPLEDEVSQASQLLFNAQIATAKFVAAISGGFLGAIAVVMTAFYIKLYVDGHAKQLGILKAMGYSDLKLCIKFWIFGLCVLIGCVLGFAAGFLAIPYVYEGMRIEGMPDIPINFHPVLFICLVAVPPIVFAFVSCFIAYFKLRRPVGEMLKGLSKTKIKKQSRNEKCSKERSFLVEMGIKSVTTKKMLTFFIVFASFCFSAMVQMGLSMDELTPGLMGKLILVIGLVLSAVVMVMAVTSLLNGNIKSVSMMKAFGYSLKECVLSVFTGYAPFALIGFVIGTAYQYGLLILMVNVIFKDVGEIPEYTFNVPVLFITLAVFIICVALVMSVCTFKIRKVSVKEVMQES